MQNWRKFLNSYPPQLPPPQQPGYNPYNPYQGYDPNADYVPWLPGRQGPRYLPIVAVVAIVLFCSCCAFLAGTVFGIELPGWLATPSSQNQNNSSGNEQPTEEPTPPEQFEWRLIYPQNT